LALLSQQAVLCFALRNSKKLYLIYCYTF